MSNPLEEIERLRLESQGAIQAADSLSALEAVHLRFLGRKDGALTQILRQLPALTPEQKRETGRLANELKVFIEATLETKKSALKDEELTKTLSSGGADLTLPGAPFLRGKPHPLRQTMDHIVSVFTSIGFHVAEGPEVETDFNNFTALNHPPDHPARDAHDTFYVKDLKDKEGKPLLLRTHTSPVQIRYMQTHKPPLYIVAPGRVFRHEAVDATHSFVFHQVEGLAIDTDLSMADLKGVLTLFAQRVFDAKTRVRLRPTFFPFVEPGVQVDISCTICKGEGACRVCKGTGWIELLGAGLVHPNVLRAVGYDPEKVSGYAFGIGVERVAMFRCGVDDMRLFYENDLRFLKQF